MCVCACVSILFLFFPSPIHTDLPSTNGHEDRTIALRVIDVSVVLGHNCLEFCLGLWFFEHGLVLRNPAGDSSLVPFSRQLMTPWKTDMLICIWKRQISTLTPVLPWKHPKHNCNQSTISYLRHDSIRGKEHEHSIRRDACQIDERVAQRQLVRFVGPAVDNANKRLRSYAMF